ncbi:uncharacterized protein [Typha latifolia]|uniref:uncharacterized protein n=1 Tax=Typha latifolia TaxID=4733 RepID=UPI003C2EF95C
MGRSSAEERRCKKHPKHKQSTGVCPFCLGEKLSRLASSSAFSSLTYASSSSASTSAYSSDSELSSLAASPPRHDMKRARLSLLLKKDLEPLTKSRSLIFVIGRRKEDYGEEVIIEKGKGKEKKEKKEKEKEKKEKRRRFWSKLLSTGSRRKEEGCSLSHSKTLKEKSGAKWVLFS